MLKTIANEKGNKSCRIIYGIGHYRYYAEQGYPE